MHNRLICRSLIFLSALQSDFFNVGLANPEQSTFYKLFWGRTEERKNYALGTVRDIALSPDRGNERQAPICPIPVCMKKNAVLKRVLYRSYNPAKLIVIPAFVFRKVLVQAGLDCFID